MVLQRLKSQSLSRTVTKLQIYLLLFQCLIFYNQNIFVISSPMFGENVRDARKYEFSFVVSLAHLEIENPNPANDHYCSGVLITRQDVLTAAHCLQNEVVTGTVIIFGSIDLGTGTMYGPLWWINYNTWAGHRNRNLRYGDNDIANIRLREEVPEDTLLPPLSPFSNTDFYGVQVQIAGWGGGCNTTISIKMKTVELNVLTNTACEYRVSSLNNRKFNVNDNRFCTATNPHALMHVGDSGAPILFRGMLIGIHEGTVPFPEQPFDPRKVNIHSGIFYYKNFILSVTRPNFSWSAS